MNNILVTLILISQLLVAQKVELQNSNTYFIGKETKTEYSREHKAYKNGFSYEIRVGKKSGRVVKINQESEIVATSEVFPGVSYRSGYYKVVFYKNKIVVFGSKKTKKGSDLYKGVLDLESLKLIDDFKKVVEIKGTTKWEKPILVYNKNNIAFIQRTIIKKKLNEQFVLMDSNGELIKSENYTSQYVGLVKSENGDYILTEGGIAFELITKFVGQRKPREYFIRKVGLKENVKKLNTPSGAFRLQWQKNENGENPFIIGLYGDSRGWPIIVRGDENRILTEGVLLGRFDPKRYESTVLIKYEISELSKVNNMDIRKTIFLPNGDLLLLIYGWNSNWCERSHITVIRTDSELKIKWVSVGPLYAASYEGNYNHSHIVGCLAFLKDGYINFLYNRPITNEAMGKHHTNTIYATKNNMELVTGKMNINNGEYSNKVVRKYPKWKEFIKPFYGVELKSGLYMFEPFKAKDYKLLKITF